ncbi:MAG: hypothetical protein L3J75_00875 [Methylococcaceae bacterium]|nr:hypothetical protein [Methylococcaceae bacterium]
MMLPLITGLAAAIALLFVGYILGIKKGQHSREMLREFMITELNQAEVPKSDQEKKLDLLLSQGDALQRVVEPLAKWDKQVETLNAAIKQVQDSVLLLDQDQGTVDLTDLKTNDLNRSNLTRLMDEIAEKGHFKVMLLSDDKGLPIAASSNAQQLDKLAAISSLVVIFGDRISQDDDESPQSFLIHYENNMDILCRIFVIGEQRMVLAVISSKQKLTTGALDSVLPKFTESLNPRIR